MVGGAHSRLAREGWSILAFLLLIVLLSILYDLAGLGLPALLLLLFSAYLLRDPLCSVPSAPLALVCPVQGRVEAVDEVEDPWLHRSAFRIRINMSCLDVFSIRSVTEGKIEEQWRCSPGNGENGTFQHAFWTRTDEGDDIVMVVRGGHLARRRLWLYLSTGERVGQGARIGYMLLGGTFEVLMPINVDIMVSPGQQLCSGDSILAHVVHKQQVSAIG